MAAKETLYVVVGSKVYEYKLGGELPTIAGEASTSSTKPAPKPTKKAKRGGRPKGSKNKPKVEAPVDASSTEAPVAASLAGLVAA